PLTLIAGRFLQGLGAGMLVPQTLTLIGITFPEEARGRAVGIWGSIAGTASIIGPLVGGVLIDGLSWRWIFFINLPVAVPVVALGLRSLPTGATRSVKFDLVGTLLAGVGLVALLYDCLLGPHAGWDLLTIACLPFAALCLLAFFWYERRVEPARAVLAPASLASVVTAPIAGRCVDDGKARLVLQIGFGASAMGTALSILIAATGVSWLWLPGATAIFGIGNGFAIAPLTTVGMSALRSEDFGAASSVLNVLRQTGPVLGGAVIGLLIQALAAVPTASDPLGLSGPTVAWVLGVPLLLFAVGLFVYSFAPRSLLGVTD